jgi:hypothetical protein
LLKHVYSNAIKKYSAWNYFHYLEK